MIFIIDFIKTPYLDVFKTQLVKGASYAGAFEFPALERSDYVPASCLPFDKALTSIKYRDWVHFYINDDSFERIWNYPEKYLNHLKKFAGVITPDFSLYREMPLSMQIWNTYRNRAIAFWLQKNGVRIIPNVRWGDERTYSFVFDGLKQGGTFAVSTNGCIQGKFDRECFKEGLEAMVNALKPNTIVNYSQTPDDIFKEYIDQGINIIQIENYALSVRKGVA